MSPDRIVPGGRLLRAWPLRGGVSAQVTALEIQSGDGRILRAVVRHHPTAARERRLLGALHAAGLPVARPLAREEGALATEFVEGRTAGRPGPAAVRRMAEVLARIHAAGDLPWLPAAAGPPPANPPTLLHGDYWPGNLVWQDRRLAAVLDWEDAARGDPLADLAGTRLEILWSSGPEAMRAFTAHYQELRPDLDPAPLPRWDLHVAARVAPKLATWGLAPAEERRMRDQLRRFAAWAEAAG